MSQNFTTVKEVEASAKTRMEKVLADLQHEMATIRTGRASINILDAVRVESYGVMSPLSHVSPSTCRRRNYSPSRPTIPRRSR